MFKKVKFNRAEGNVVTTYEAKDVSMDDVIKILKDENVLSFTATKMTPSEYLKSTQPIKI